MNIKNNSGLQKDTKIKHMHQLADYRVNTLRPNHPLHSLFIELTTNCNERCRHCGSNCGEIKEEDSLTTDEIKGILDQVKEDFDISKLQLNVTGGEPLLRKDFFEIMNYANELGFTWGMTSNGTLITPECAHKLHLADMKTISISVDGLEENHDWFRQIPGSYKKTMAGIKALLNEDGFKHVQITTVVHRKNIDELEAMYQEFSKIGVKSWRVIGIEPIGRAKEQPELLLKKKDQQRLFKFIADHRFSGKMEVIYGCSHYLGVNLEREVRKWYFLCNAGVYTASITANGNIVACLDIERRPELVQGNIRTDCLKDIWENKFEIFRTDYRKTGKCKNCKDYEFCAGDSFHTWNFDKMEPNLCMKGILF